MTETPDALQPGTGVTRSASATTAPIAARVARQRLARPSGWWGMALFLCAEVTIFGSLVATYFYLDFDSTSWPPYGIKPPSVALPLIATGVLVVTLIPVFLAATAARTGQREAVIGFLTVAVVVQTAYLALQILLFRHDLNDFSPQHSAYASIYFTLLAAHHAHVAVGLFLDLGVLISVASRGLTNYWLTGVRALALYWYVVGGLAVFVVLTQLSPSL